MNEPTTSYGHALLETVSEEIRRSELGGSSDRLLFVPISRRVYEVYKRNPSAWDIRLLSDNNGLVSMILTAKSPEEPF